MHTVVSKQKVITENGADLNISVAADALESLKNDTNGHDFLLQHAFRYTRMYVTHIIPYSCR